MLAGRTERARGVVARGHTLVVRFKRPAPNFLARTALPFFCAVPPWLPPSAEGIGKIPSAGPYYVKEYRAGRGHRDPAQPLLRRRAHCPSRRLRREPSGRQPGGAADGASTAATPTGAGWPPASSMTPGLDFEARYGLEGRFRVRPGLTLRMLAFNSSRPLFRNNPRLRRAVNLALDRLAHVASSYGPVASRATGPAPPPRRAGVPRCERLPARGQPRSCGRARARPPAKRQGRTLTWQITRSMIRIAQLVKKQLAPIGLDIEIKPGPGGALRRRDRQPDSSRDDAPCGLGHRVRAVGAEHPRRARVPEPPPGDAPSKRRDADSGALEARARGAGPGGPPATRAGRATWPMPKWTR